MGSLATKLTRGASKLPKTSTPAPTGEARRSARIFKLGLVNGPINEITPLLTTKS